MRNAFTAVAKIYIHSQAELVVCFCKATQPRWGYFAPQGQKPEAEAELWEWHPRRAETKTFSFLKVSESSGFWRTRFATPAATRGRARETEIIDTSKRSFTFSQGKLPPYIHKVSHIHSRSQLVFAGPWPWQSSQWGTAILQFSFSLLLLCWCSLLPFFCMLEANPRYITYQTMFCVCHSLSSPLTTFFCTVLKPTHSKRELALTFVSASTIQAFLL